MQHRSYAVLLEADPDGGYTAIAPTLPEVVTEGDTLEDTLANAHDAIALCLEDLAEQHAGIPPGGTRV
jgi:antitoxin HicB